MSKKQDLTYTKGKYGGKNGGPWYDPKTWKWYNSKGQELSSTTGYYSKGSGTYQYYNSNGTLSRLTPRQHKNRQNAKRVNFSRVPISENRNRPIVVDDMEALQDSLIARGWGLPQRLAAFATASSEMGKKGYASKGIGGNGYFGLNKYRMNPALLKDREAQITHSLNNLQEMVGPPYNNWLQTPEDGMPSKNRWQSYNGFWNAKDPITATRYLTEGNIRPAETVDEGKRRARIAKNFEKYIE